MTRSPSPSLPALALTPILVSTLGSPDPRTLSPLARSCLPGYLTRSGKRFRTLRLLAANTLVPPGAVRSPAPRAREDQADGLRARSRRRAIPPSAVSPRRFTIKRAPTSPSRPLRPARACCVMRRRRGLFFSKWRAQSAVCSPPCRSRAKESIPSTWRRKPYRRPRSKRLWPRYPRRCPA